MNWDQRSKESTHLIFESKSIVSAGAGAGKTTRLVQHISENFKSFKTHRKTWPKIVGTTFTKKAALEIKDRVSNLQYTDSQNNPLNKELADFSYSEYLNIGTIHSLCYQLLKPRAHMLGFQGPLKFVTPQSLNFQTKSLAIQIGSQKYKDIFEFFSLSKLLKILKNFEDPKFLNTQPLELKDFESAIESEINGLVKKWKLLYIPSEWTSLGDSKGVLKARDFFKDLDQIFKKVASEKELIYLKEFFESSNIRKPSLNFDKISSHLKIQWKNLNGRFYGTSEMSLKNNFVINMIHTTTKRLFKS